MLCVPGGNPVPTLPAMMGDQHDLRDGATIALLAPDGVAAAGKTAAKQMLLRSTNIVARIAPSLRRVASIVSPEQLVPHSVLL
jgi:hypothetical protein